ncbi:AT-rich interactive domain-containing protein 2-like isoform X2 [Ruditapes philippinarum]|uniref:AT-rich interactive domain-containing protein 2-like isoform X2 n=1 Tax=Ruditapes philippinarum TaxID=129788 RepID=UPI00295BC0CB|nr:AT-rich interactive domain-containing protein 2-like isoform X2 [Ruditapes philippinarum]
MAKNPNKDLRRYEQEKREFIDGLRNFHYNRGTSFQLLPRCGNKEVDLYLLYQTVTRLGGWKKVTENEHWTDVLEELGLPVACLNVDQALKFIYIRYLNIYEQIHFLGEDPKTVDTRRDDEGPIRKKHCGSQYNVPLTYNHAQHDVAGNLRAGFGLCTKYAKHSDYDKLEKALLSGLPNEVDFVINVCTLLSNESKHTLRLDKCAVLTELLLAHIGIFNKGDLAMEKLYENGWRKNSDRDFIRFWFDTVTDVEARDLISFTRKDSRNLTGKEVLQLGRNLGVEDKEGIRITQIAIIIRNLSFDADNMKFLATNDLVFRFLLLCLHCTYGSLRQLALDTLGNLSAQFILDPSDSFKSEAILSLVVKCITSSDKFAVVTGLEMVSKLSKQEENEYVISERLDTNIYEEIAKYLTISDIQLIVYSLEALYQLSEIGEETNSKIAEVSNTVDTLVSLITVEAQSYGPNSLIGIKVVEYCPPPHLTGGVTEGVPAAVGPPPGTGTPQPSQSQPPGQQGSMIHASSLKKGDSSDDKGDKSIPDTPTALSPMETTACNWMKANYEVHDSSVTTHISMYKEYLSFCKRFQLNQPLASQDFLKCLKTVFPKTSSAMAVKEGGSREMCVLGVRKRAQQLPFSISCPGVPGQQTVQRPVNPLTAPVQNISSNTITMPTYANTGGILAQGFVSSQESSCVTSTVVNTPPSSKSKPVVVKRKGSSKKNAPILPRPEQNASGNLPNIVPRITPSNINQQTVVQQPVIQNVQFTTQDVVYQTVDAQNPEAKVMVKTLLAKKIRQGNVIIQQPVQGMMNVDLSGAGDGQTIQYQTGFPQSQTTYIQYAAPSSTIQTGGQTFIQSQPTSQVQTYVVQPGDVYVQGQIPASSLNTQMVAQQAPMMVAPQQQILTQSQGMVSQQQMVVNSQQPVFVSQHQFMTQQPLIQSQSMPNPQFVTQQVVVQPQMTADLQTSQIPLQMSSSSLSSAPSNIATASLSLSSVNSSTGAVYSVSASQSNVNYTETNNSTLSNGQQSLNTGIFEDVVSDVQKVENNPSETDSLKPSSVENTNNSTSNLESESKLDLSSTDAVAEIESAVGSIMDDGSESQDEPVMIENDGNELMFEQKYQVNSERVQYDNVNNTTEVYESDEAAMAVEQLEQMEHSGEVDENDLVETVTNECTEESMDINESNEAIVGNDQMLNDQITDNEECVLNGDFKESSVEKEALVSDAELIAKFRSETPINVPIVSENGLLEQDFEARMAVENLLKDVEFKVSSTDEDSLEGNVNVILCQTENPSSVKTTSSGGDNEIPPVEDSEDSVVSESQTISKTNVVNHNGPSITDKSSENNSHVLQNGIDNGVSKPLLNGDISSPECPSVPSPGLVNGGETTKLVNGITEEDIDTKSVDKIIRMNGVVNHKVSPVSPIKQEETKIDSENNVEKTDESLEQTILNKSEDILAQSMIDSNIDKNSEDSNDQTEKCESVSNKDDKTLSDGDILARSIFENDIQPSDCEMPEPEPTSVTAVVKQIIPNTMYGNIMTVQINNNTIPITFTNNAIISSKNSLGNQINVCSSRHIPTPESARDGELSCDSTTSSTANSDLSSVVSDKHSIAVSQSKTSHKDSKKSLASPKSSDSGKKSKAKKRSRSKSGGSGSTDSRPSSATSPAAASSSLPEYMCEWTQCKQCFDNARSVFYHVCSTHLKTEYDGLCKWEGCESLVRKRWSLFTHVQDHHCSESSLRVAAQRRLQSFQTGQKIAAPTIPAMVYPNDAANQAIKRFLPKPPYPEFLEGREGPVTKHIRLTSALILRNLAKYSAAGRSLLKKHERVISYTCMSAVESSTALAKCLHEIVKDQ